MADDKTKKKAPPVNNEASWEVARQYTEILGRPHTLFTNAIRFLRGMTQEGKTTVWENEPYPLNVLLKSSSFRAILYYAAAALRKEELSKVKELDGFALLKVFPPDELSSVLAATYLYRKVKKHCDVRVWETLAQEIQIQMEAGFLVGSKIPAIGTTRGLLTGVIRYAALSLFSVKDPRNFRMFRRDLNEKEKLFDTQGELERWGCDHLQIASVLLQSIGMGIPAAKGIAALQPSDAKGQDEKEIMSWFAAKSWIQSLIEDERAPEWSSQDPNFSLDGEKLAQLHERVDSIYEMGSTFDWIEKTKEDLPKSLFDKLGANIPEAAPTPTTEVSVSEDAANEII
jgi:hypothetical protein